MERKLTLRLKSLYSNTFSTVIMYILLLSQSLEKEYYLYSYVIKEKFTPGILLPALRVSTETKI